MLLVKNLSRDIVGYSHDSCGNRQKWSKTPEMTFFEFHILTLVGLIYVGRILEFRKLDFRGLKCQFDIKKVDFWGLVAKIGYSRPILTFRTHLWPIFID